MGRQIAWVLFSPRKWRMHRLITKLNICWVHKIENFRASSTAARSCGFSTAVSTADFQPPKNRLMIWLMYSCWCTQCTQCTHKKIVQCTQRTPQCTQSVHTCQMFTTSGRVQLYTVRQYRMSVRCMAATDIRISTSSREFSTRIFLPTQIYRILENFFDFSKVPDRFSTSWNS